jgi:hypothetical protein
MGVGVEGDGGCKHLMNPQSRKIRSAEQRFNSKKTPRKMEFQARA